MGYYKTYLIGVVAVLVVQEEEELIVTHMVLMELEVLNPLKKNYVAVVVEEEEEVVELVDIDTVVEVVDIDIGEVELDVAAVGRKELDNVVVDYRDKKKLKILEIHLMKKH